jgi:AraC family transcriptional regulator
MNPHFCTISESNKLSLNKPAGCDVVYYSELNEWFTTDAFRNFSLKYVVDRCIYYKAGNKEHSVEAGHFLMACKQPHVKAYFDSGNTVKSICIDIRPETIAEALTILSAEKDHDFDKYLAGYFSSPRFFETVSPLTAAIPFANQLNTLVKAIESGEGSHHVNKEWFLDLAEKIIYHEYGNYLSLNGIRSVKLETRKELLCRLLIAKQFIDESFLCIEDVNEVAVFCNLSEFHFFRSFRQAFGITPYKYILNKRLELARDMIQFKQMSLTQVAMHCNFPDIFTFSKAFKRRFGKAPSVFTAG